MPPGMRHIVAHEAVTLSKKNFGKRGVSTSASPWAYQIRSWTASHCCRLGHIHWSIRILHIPTLGSRKTDQLAWVWRNSLHTKRAQLHGAFVPNESFRATLALFHTDLCIRIICRSGLSSIPTRSGLAIAS